MVDGVAQEKKKNDEHDHWHGRHDYARALTDEILPIDLDD
jgi:hypothetical protein